MLTWAHAWRVTLLNTNVSLKYGINTPWLMFMAEVVECKMAEVCFTEFERFKLCSEFKCQYVNVRVIYHGVSKKKNREGGRLVWHALRMPCSVLPSKIIFFSLFRTVLAVCTMEQTPPHRMLFDQWKFSLPSQCINQIYNECRKKITYVECR
jgi:hypothetical protein